MSNLPRYKKIEIAVFGLLSPFILATYTAILILQQEAIFWGRGSIAIYHGTEAMFVSLLWFGISLMMFSCFFLKPMKLIRFGKYKVTLYFSMALIIIGLASAIALV